MRTHGTGFTGTPVFETGAFNHSATHPNSASPKSYAIFDHRDKCAPGTRLEATCTQPCLPPTTPSRPDLQRPRRLDARRPTRGNHDGRNSHDREQRHDRAEGRGITRGHAIQGTP
jgi:hypothetical protein